MCLNRGLTCGDIAQCPEALIIRDLLLRFHSFKDKVDEVAVPSITGALHSVLKDHNIKITDLQDIVHRLECAHGVDSNDGRFDELSVFLKQCTVDNPCTASDCPFVQRRQKLVDEEQSNDVVLFDILYSVHSLFAHSLETD